MTTFREDGAEAVDWAASYLERVGELPVLSQVAPGDIRSALPASPPEEPEPFAAVLRDLDETLLRGITHWQSPRFFAYFATTASEPGILAELLIACLNQVGDPLAHVARAAGARGGHARLAAPAPRPARVLRRPHRGHGLHRHAFRRSRSRVRSAPSAASSSAPSTRTRSADKAARLLELELRKVPVDDDVPAAGRSAGPRRRLRRRRDDRDDGRGRVRSRPGDRGRLPRRRSLARTSTRRTPGRPPCARSSVRTSRAGSARTRSASTRTSGSGRRWTARRSGRAGRRTSGARSASSPSSSSPRTTPST